MKTVRVYIEAESEDDVNSKMQTIRDETGFCDGFMGSYEETDEKGAWKLLMTGDPKEIPTIEALEFVLCVTT
jgi:hypothetical protein